ncbi:hypothetical protein [uncultured Paludibaculum sp.]|uniref:hypothetical protein n=1 Tax=uncultured Paludibaculum sp. TaxID=1765020 RepID=UPI002AAA82FF|nr:hypothetical protein [uncultured Paludibaculum sp.]
MRETLPERSRRIALDPMPEQEIRAQLERVLASPPFRNSRRCQLLLRYAVEKACAGHLDELKERVVGSAVFGRDACYDTNQDAVVRNAAAEVRKKLAQYYLEPVHANEPRIELPPGSYLPEFHPQVSEPKTPLQPTPSHVVWPIWAFCILAGALLFAAGIFAGRPKAASVTALDQFWKPVIESKGEVQFCIGQTRTHSYVGSLPATLSGAVDSKATVPVSKLVPNLERFLWMGDAVAMSKISGYLSGKGKDARYRWATSTPYSELRGKSAVMIGLFNNEWTIRLTEGLRFSLVKNDAEKWRGVKDHQSPAPFAWRVLRKGGDWTDETDYAMVTRVFDPSTEQFVVAAGGITHLGTMMTGDFLTSPTYLAEALRGAPSDWAKRNMQIVLSTHVVGGTPGPPNVLAIHFW